MLHVKTNKNHKDMLLIVKTHQREEKKLLLLCKKNKDLIKINL